MARKLTQVRSPIGDALLLAALFLPFVPIITTFQLYLTGLALGCPDAGAQSCAIAGFDFGPLHGHSISLLAWTAKASRSGGVLLIYMLLLAVLAQLTTKGFRGRVVRTCAVIMWAGVMPLLLAIALAIAVSPEQLCGSGPCNAATLLASFAALGNIFFHWLANIAVPIAVLVSGLLALTLGYRALIGRFVALCTQRD